MNTSTKTLNDKYERTLGKISDTNKYYNDIVQKVITLRNEDRKINATINNQQQKIKTLENKTAPLSFDPSNGVTTIDGKLLLSNPIQSKTPSLSFSYVKDSKLLYGENKQISPAFLQSSK